MEAHRWCVDFVHIDCVVSQGKDDVGRKYPQYDGCVHFVMQK